MHVNIGLENKIGIEKSPFQNYKVYVWVIILRLISKIYTKEVKYQVFLDRLPQTQIEKIC